MYKTLEVYILLVLVLLFSGYVSMDMDNGSVRWRTINLRFPSLPVLDAKGALWGSDGHTIMHYAVDGRLIESIKLITTMRPLFRYFKC